MRVTLPAFAQTAWARITASRLTTAFFVVALLHCIIQLVFQAWAFKTNAHAGTFLSTIIEESGITNNWAVLIQNGELRLCGPEDKGKDIMECEVVWDGRLAEALNRTEVTPTSTSSAIALPTAVLIPDVEVVTENPVSLEDDDDLESISSGQDDNDDDDEEEEEEDREDLRDLAAAVGLPTVGGINYAAGVIPVEVPTSAAASGASRRAKRDSSVIAIQAVNGSVTGIELPTIASSNGTPGVEVDLKCVQMLVWPNQMIRNTKREDVTFMAFQIWVFGMSFVAIIHESIPHVIAALLTHVLATVWSGYQIWNTGEFRDEFVRTTIEAEVCKGINLLPNYWKDRHVAEVGVLVVNVVSLLASFWFTWRLVKAFGWQTFKRIGASIEVNRIYKICLTFSIGLQLASFFVVVSMSLWFDFLLNTTLGQRAFNKVMYQVIAIVVIALMLPWFGLGWYSFRRENKITMYVFLSVCIVMLAGWGGMFASNTFRWTFKDWPFFSAMSSASSALTLLTSILGVVVLRNFEKGLKPFLSPESESSDEWKSSPSDIEKAGLRVEFPSQPIPTYEAAFGGRESPVHQPIYGAPVYSQESIGSQRSYNTLLHEPPLTVQTTLDRSLSQNSARSASDYGESPADLRRQASTSSNGSSVNTQSSNGKSYASAGSHHAVTSTTKHTRDLTGSQAAKKGWVIE